MDKESIRQDILRKRDGLSQDEVAERSEAIRKRFLRTSFYRRADTILFYFPKGKEVDTAPMIRQAMAEGKTVVLPITEPSTKALRLCAVKDLDADLIMGRYGIKEPSPARCRQLALDGIGLIVAPAVAVDERGNRLGYGLGYYDRLLAAYKGRTAAVVYDFQVLERIPAESHDIPIGNIVTESRTVACRKLNK